MPSLFNSETRAPSLTGLLIRSSRRRTLRRLALLCCAAMLLGLLMLALGCAHQAPIACEQPKPIPAPALHQSPSTTSYSAQLAEQLKGWRLQLMPGNQTQ